MRVWAQGGRSPTHTPHSHPSIPPAQVPDQGERERKKKKKEELGALVPVVQERVGGGERETPLEVGRDRGEMREKERERGERKRGRE